ncbi:hypothetical protein HDU98_002308 [Podochytrium sp. JEL0797]|nr:hypothetical protein HDU98_002308 [Podochytrium sp. JEL0797]
MRDSLGREGKEVGGENQGTGEGEGGEEERVVVGMDDDEDDATSLAVVSTKPSILHKNDGAIDSPFARPVIASSTSSTALNQQQPPANVVLNPDQIEALNALFGYPISNSPTPSSNSDSTNAATTTAVAGGSSSCPTSTTSGFPLYIKDSFYTTGRESRSLPAAGGSMQLPPLTTSFAGSLLVRSFKSQEGAQLPPPPPQYPDVLVPHHLELHLPNHHAQYQYHHHQRRASTKSLVSKRSCTALGAMPLRPLFTEPPPPMPVFPGPLSQQEDDGGLREQEVLSLREEGIQEEEEDVVKGEFELTFRKKKRRASSSLFMEALEKNVNED